MKIKYRGFKIEAKREPSLGDGVLLYYSILRESDGLEFESNFTSGSETPSQMIEYLKGHVDDYIENPQNCNLCPTCGGTGGVDVGNGEGIYYDRCPDCYGTGKVER